MEQKPAATSSTISSPAAASMAGDADRKQREQGAAFVRSAWTSLLNSMWLCSAADGRLVLV